MESFNLSAYVALALALAIYAAPTSNIGGDMDIISREQDATSSEGFIFPFLRGPRILPPLRAPPVPVLVQKVAAPVTHAVSDALGTSAGVAFEALPVAGEVLHGLGLRDDQTADEDSDKKPKHKKVAAAAPPPPDAVASVDPATDAVAADAPAAADEEVIARDVEEAEKGKKKKKTEAVPPPPPSDEPELTADTAATPDADTADVEPRDIAEEAKRKKPKAAPAVAPPSEEPDVADAAPIADTSNLTAGVQV
ncbi:hypothetical protein CPB84DRAFT_1791026 [Gymnopilus junonius]|uniref:Uncharacterized protein n=1 Tax=Gymnopilus junonius TaxID=109634 RepID=A0A9P5NE70_GYMJU|nr:hypothetical protein CPB84DRAFT_1791026 [Gymnopilus junonius]